MPTLARKLRVTDYFTLAFGTMVGVGWLVLMDDWLGRGGPLGAALGFALGGLLLLPVGYVYGQWVQRLPDAASEAAYTAQVFPPVVSFFTGWVMLLAYFIVCPWEAVAIGKVAAYIFPSLNSFALYSVAGQPVFLPRLLLGIAMTVFLTLLNYYGIRLSATFQNWTASTVILLFLLLLAIPASPRSHPDVHSDHAVGARCPVRSILVMPSSGSFPCTTDISLAPGRSRFCTARRQRPPAAFGRINEKFQTPAVAILGIAAATIAGLLLGDALLVPVTEVGSMASAFGWLATCVSFFLVERNLRSRVFSSLGILVAALLLIMKLIPAFPGHFTQAEWIALAVWLVLGASLHLRSSFSPRTSANSASLR